MIWTKFRSIFPLSITRGKIARKRARSRVDKTAHNSAGMSFIKPFSRQYTAVFATNSGSMTPHKAVTWSS